MKTDYLLGYLTDKYKQLGHDHKVSVGTVSEDLSILTENGKFIFALPMVSTELSDHNELTNLLVGYSVVVTPLEQKEFNRIMWERYYQDSLSNGTYQRIRNDWQPFTSEHAPNCYRISWVYVEEDGPKSIDAFKEICPTKNVFMSESYYYSNYLGLI